VGDGLPHLRSRHEGPGILGSARQLLLILVLAAPLACERGPSTAPAVALTPTPLDLATTGTIDGEVFFDGTPPPPRTIPVGSDPTCAAAHPGGLVIHDVHATDGRLAEVFVYVAQGLEDRVFPVPDTPVVIDQRGCWYVPRVAGVQAGQPIRFRSSDDTLHNVHGEPRESPRWNFGLPRQGSERALTLAGPEIMVPVRCDVHPWMRLDLGVVPHPYFAVTGDDGRFRFPNVPAGRYHLAAWHPKLGRQEQPIEVQPQRTAPATFRFAAPDRQPSP
jgi:plastocyanin